MPVQHDGRLMRLPQQHRADFILQTINRPSLKITDHGSKLSEPDVLTSQTRSTTLSLSLVSLKVH